MIKNNNHVLIQYAPDADFIGSARETFKSNYNVGFTMISLVKLNTGFFTV